MTIMTVGQVGVQQLKSGSTGPIRLGATGEEIVQQLHGRYAETMMRGNLYSAANQAAQAVSAALATAYTGLLLYNPPGSGIIAILLKVKYALSVAPVAIATKGLLAGWAATGGVTAQTTLLTIQSNQVGNSSRGKCVALAAATIVTPTWLHQLEDGFTAAALPAPVIGQDLEGLFGILPGGFIGVGALTAITGLGSMEWEEVPYPDI